MNRSRSSKALKARPSSSLQTASEGELSKRHILDCAARIFRERGYAAASLRDIATAAGMTTASLYYHFSSKDEIVAEVLNTAVRTVFSEVKRNVEQLPEDAYADRIKAAIEAHLRAIFETDDYNGASIRIFAQLPPHIGKITFEEREAYVRYWIDLLRQARQNGVLRDVDLTMVRLFLFGAMNWTPQWYKPGRYSITQVAERLFDVFLHGVSDKSSRFRAKAARNRE
jgi:AcrR family transcriptional regulator